MIAPFPAFDSVEAPFSFIAITFAEIEEPYGKEQGAALRVETGIVHNLSVTIVPIVPLQLTESTVNVAPSPCLTLIMQAVTVAPFAVGSYQLIVTVSGANEVVGIAGAEGLSAARIVTAVEFAPYPNAFRA